MIWSGLTVLKHLSGIQVRGESRGNKGSLIKLFSNKYMVQKQVHSPNAMLPACNKSNLTSFPTLYPTTSTKLLEINRLMYGITPYPLHHTMQIRTQRTKMKLQPSFNWSRPPMPCWVTHRSVLGTTITVMPSCVEVRERARDGWGMGWEIGLWVREKKVVIGGLDRRKRKQNVCDTIISDLYIPWGKERRRRTISGVREK